jgi:CubicO group peptidase (beta-lactamase class C family)
MLKILPALENSIKIMVNGRGEQLLDSAFVAKSITPRFAESPQYGYGFWMQKRDGKSFFMMRGHLGQYVIVEPEDNIIIVRLGPSKIA